MVLGRIKDERTLREVARCLSAHNERLVAQNRQLINEVHSLKNGDPSQLALEIEKLEAQLAKHKKALFGASSEQRGQTAAAKRQEPQPGHGRREQPALPFEEIEHEADVSDETCPICNGGLEEWEGFFDESEVIDVNVRSFVRKIHKCKKYKCECGSSHLTADGPRKLIRGGRYSANFAIMVAIDKYADHLPLERQVRAMARDGLIIDSQTLWDQIKALSDLLQPVYFRMQDYVLSQSVIGADETSWRLLGTKAKSKGGKGKKWQAWVIVCPDAAFYSFEDSRSAEAAERVFKNYAGTVLTDGYQVYGSLSKRCGSIRQAFCWAHVRRKFVEIEDMHPGKCTAILDLIGELYGIEKRHKDKPPDERLKIRQRESKVVVEKIAAWVNEQSTFKRGTLGAAIKYMEKLWLGLLVFLEDPDVELDNNRSERALRGVVLGRKNHLGSRSKAGIKTTALFYTLIESAKLCGIDPREYLKSATEAALSGRAIPLPHEFG